MRTRKLFSYAMRFAGVLTAASIVATTVQAAPPADAADVRLVSVANRNELSRSLATDPTDPSRVVAAIDAEDRCLVRASSDGGQTWAASVPLPTPPSGWTCADPVVAFAPDGQRLHAVYGGRREFETALFYVASTDGGATWSAPTAIPPPPDDFIFCCASADVRNQRLATPLRPAGADYVYLAGNVFIGESSFALAFTRSADGGATWSPWTKIAIHSKFYYPFNEGMSVSGGRDGNVAIAWDKTVSVPVGGDFVDELRIQVARSTDYGAMFASPVVAARERGTVAYPYGGDPDARFADNGALHLVYTRVRPGVDFSTIADIRHVASATPPYSAWSSPVTVSNAPFDGESRATPMLAVERCGIANLLHVAWTDGRRGTDLRDLFYTRKLVRPGETWSANIRVSGPTPPAVIPGDPLTYDSPTTGLTAGGGTAIAVWADRRDGNASDSDVFTSRISAGLACP